MNTLFRREPVRTGKSRLPAEGVHAVYLRILSNFSSHEGYIIS